MASSALRHSFSPSISSFGYVLFYSELVLASLSRAVQLKFVRNLDFSTTAAYVETVTKSVSVFSLLLIPFSFRAFYSPFDDSKAFLISPPNMRPITGFSIFSILHIEGLNELIES